MQGRQKMPRGMSRRGRFIADPLAELDDLRAVLAPGRAGEPERAAVAGDEVMGGDQFAGLQRVMEQDRRADRDAVAGDGGGDVEIFGR
jgi:hypothetical protein